MEIADHASRQAAPVATGRPILEEPIQEASVLQAKRSSGETDTRRPAEPPVAGNRDPLPGQRQVRNETVCEALFHPDEVMPLHNRVRLIALHISWYGFRTQSRLAYDSGISKAAVSRVVRYRTQPSLSIALRLTRALSKRMGRRLDVWEVFSLDGSYPTASVCDLCGCRSCSLADRSSNPSTEGGL